MSYPYNEELALAILYKLPHKPLPLISEWRNIASNNYWKRRFQQDFGFLALTDVIYEQAYEYALVFYDKYKFSNWHAQLKDIILPRLDIIFNNGLSLIERDPLELIKDDLMNAMVIFRCKEVLEKIVAAVSKISKEEIESYIFYFNSAIITAISYNYIDFIKLCLEKDIDIELIENPEDGKPNGKRVLMLAAKLNRVKIANLLAQHSVKTKNGAEAIYIAVLKNHPGVVKALDGSYKYDFKECLRIAAITDNLKLFIYFRNRHLVEELRMYMLEAEKYNSSSIIYYIQDFWESQYNYNKD